MHQAAAQLLKKHAAKQWGRQQHIPRPGVVKQLNRATCLIRGSSRSQQVSEVILTIC